MGQWTGCVNHSPRQMIHENGVQLHREEILRIPLSNLYFLSDDFVGEKFEGESIDGELRGRRI